MSYSYQQVKSIGTETDQYLQRAEEGKKEMERDCLVGNGFPFSGNKMFWN